ncbi:hypothetical protein KO489_12625 [Reinekea forsetii]|nr:hypothetical protein [Reinekea forsetii]
MKNLVYLIVSLTFLLSSCATLKPINKANESGYLLAPTNTKVRLYDNAKADYRFSFRFGVIDKENGKVRYFSVEGNDPKHAVIKYLPAGSYRLYSEQRRYKGGGGDDVELLPDTIYPFYEPFEFTIASGEISILPWYFGIEKVVTPAYDIDSEAAESQPLSQADLCNSIPENHDNWVTTWQNNIEGFEDYLKADRVKFGGASVKDICK